jgi:hypothetical protein
MNQPTEPEFLDDVGLKKPDRSPPRGRLITRGVANKKARKLSSAGF